MKIKELFFTAPLLIVGTIIFHACSSGESIQQKMVRFEPRATNKNIVPEITSLEIKNNKERTPASSTMTKDTKESIETNNKKIYFYSLLNQYETMLNFTNQSQAPHIKICPNFHTGTISYYETHSTDLNKRIPFQFSYDQNSINDTNYIKLHPELNLPLDFNNKHPNVVDIFKKNSGTSNINELMSKAIDIHLTKTYSELKELCDFGGSDNYYIYENLVSHINQHSFKPSKENMDILLKTTLYSNQAIIESLNSKILKNGRMPAQANDDKNDNNFIKSSKTVWAREYFKSLKN